MSKLKSRILGLLYCTPMSLINMENNNSLSIKFNILSLATIIHILISSLGVNQLAETQYFSHSHKYWESTNIGHTFFTKCMGHSKMCYS